MRDYVETFWAQVEFQETTGTGFLAVLVFVAGEVEEPSDDPAATTLKGLISDWIDSANRDNPGQNWEVKSYFDVQSGEEFSDFHATRFFCLLNKPILVSLLYASPVSAIQTSQDSAVPFLVTESPRKTWSGGH